MISPILNDLVDQINNSTIGTGITATVSADRSLVITAATGDELTFSEDSSGALAALGINVFFSGSTGEDVGVSEVIRGDASLLGAGAENITGSNAVALEIAALQDKSVESLGGKSLREYWQAGVNELAVRTNAANTRLEGATLVRESLDAQNAAVSGVSLDEEAIDLLSFQRQFQAAARFISVIDETLQSLMAIV